ncbi:TatD family hydrolase [Ruania halotolerans]|uniref:TatD family hydrolase n=1 Tax=Ruania halotolerans TaxID=2897773 RepID=UPI001E35497D|nr:TatD family hydrolase [Ruania halotolerans]UFU07395.1 TatD family hydrolase [Ruania halotolerans]
MARKREKGFPPSPDQLPVGVVDNHTHLESIADVLPDGVADPGLLAHLEHGRAVGVDAVVQIGCDLESARWSVQAAAEHPSILAGVAIHPNEAVLHAGVREVAPDGLEPDPAPRHKLSLEVAIAEIADLARADRVRTVGETGLDYFRAGEAGRAAQREAFRAHIALAKELDLPLQIHDRDAHADVLAILAADGPPARTVFHCFSGDAAMARECVARGYFLSFSGTVTFNKSEELRRAAAEAPAEQLLVETDAPYLTPHPYRGRPNAPYLLPLTLATMASVRTEPLEVLCATIRTTSEALYGPW